MKDKVILITGCSSGIGLVTAKYLSEKGYSVVPTVRKKSDISLLPNAKLLDVTWEQEKINEVIKGITKEFGRIDVVINNAGLGLVGSIRESSEKDFRDLMETNLFGVYKTIIAVLPEMKKQKGGLIINISSILGLFSVPDFGLYSASKFALEGLSQSLRLEEMKNNIKVVSVNPGAFKTKFYKNALGNTDGYSPEGYGRQPIDVAKLVAKIIETKKPQMNYIVGKEKLLVKTMLALPKRFRESLLKKYYT